MQTLWAINPRRKSRKTRSAAQKRATAKMLAANRAKRGPARKRRAKSHRRTSAVSTVRRSVRRFSKRRSVRRFSSGLRTSGIVGMLKAGAIGGAGAVAVDIGMGQVAGFLPESMNTPLDTVSGGPNYGYFATKAALAIALGHFGKRLSPSLAPRMAEGALTVLAYQFMRPMVPASMTMGYVNPAPTMRPRLSGAGAYQNIAGAGAYINVRRSLPVGRGAGASRVVGISAARRRRAGAD